MPNPFGLNFGPPRPATDEVPKIIGLIRCAKCGDDCLVGHSPHCCDDGVVWPDTIHASITESLVSFHPPETFTLDSQQTLWDFPMRWSNGKWYGGGLEAGTRDLGKGLNKLGWWVILDGESCTMTVYMIHRYGDGPLIWVLNNSEIGPPGVTTTALWGEIVPNNSASIFGPEDCDHPRGLPDLDALGSYGGWGRMGPRKCCDPFYIYGQVFEAGVEYQSHYWISITE